MLLASSTPPEPAGGAALVVSVRGGRVALVAADGPPPAGAAPLFVGTVDGRPCWALDDDGAGDLAGEEMAGADDAGDDMAGGDDDGAADAPPAGAGAHVDLMQLFGAVDDGTWAAAGRAVQLVEWRRTHRFCSRCGTPTEDAGRERARRCPACGLLAFPRLAPAVIALVERQDGRALLARNARWPTPMYSCLAGFVEPGETVEQALRREVEEEVGVRVGAVSYVGSQPWPFPHSLMLGFRAAYAGGDIRCNDEEIADAAWFAPDALPAVPGPVSIARRLIDDWVARSAGR